MLLFAKLIVCSTVATARMVSGSSDNEEYFGASACDDEICQREEKNESNELFLLVRMGIYAALIFSVLMYQVM